MLVFFDCLYFKSRKVFPFDEITSFGKEAILLGQLTLPELDQLKFEYCQISFIFILYLVSTNNSKQDTSTQMN